MVQHLRVGRHTSDIEVMKAFYIDILGLNHLGEFSDHDGYSAVFIGSKDHSWHLEFTENGLEPDHKPDEDDLLIFYTANELAYDKLIDKLEVKGLKSVKAKNVYWDLNGRTYLDPDGYRVVICNRQWSYE